MKVSEVLVFFWIFICEGWAAPAAAASKGGFSLRIIHTNDIHARFEQTSRDSGVCEPQDAASGNCYGGFARLATLIRQYRADKSIPTLYLDAGDLFEGSTLYTFYKWEIASKMMSFLKPDVMALGNHEFDDGPTGLAPFVQHADFPIIASNLDTTSEPGLSPIKKSIILTIAGNKIGIIGYVTPDTAATADAGGVIFHDEINCLRSEVKRLQGEGVKILIALGHSGYPVDMKIAKEVEGLDLVVGGHTHTFLNANDKIDIESPKGPYPTIVHQVASGRKVYVVQAYAYTKYLGHFRVDFDAGGEVIKFDGAPVLIDSRIKGADDVLEELGRWRERIDQVLGQPVGYSRVNLDGDFGSCRRGECNLGNLIVDAMIDHNLRATGLYPEGWTDAPVALFNSGNIRASVKKIDEQLTMGDILNVLPYKNELVKVHVPGIAIMEFLEWSVYNLKHTDVYLSGNFIQHAGLRVVYDLTRPSGHKVVNVDIRCGDCKIPEYEPIDKFKFYNVLTIDFLRSGGDNFTMFEPYNWISLDVTVDQILADYIARNTPIVPGLEDRIRFLKNDRQPRCLGPENLSSALVRKAQHV